MLENLGDLMSQSDSTSVMLVCSLASFVSVVAALFLSSEWARRAREGDDALAGAGTLREGGTVVIGVVRTDGEPAVTVTLHEMGREWSTKEGVRHAWTETSREVSSRAFIVVTDKNERVRVEPPSDVLLVDHLRVTAQPSRVHRERRAELVEGERVTVTGRLHHVRAGSTAKAYRDAHVESDIAWVLEPPARGRMVVSTEPLTERARDWASFHRKLAIVPLLYLLVVNAVAYRSFYDFALHGRPVVGHVRERERSESYGQHGPQAHFRMYVDIESQGAWVPLDGATYYDVVEGAAVPVVLTPAGRVSLGAEPGLNVWTAVGMLLGGALLLLSCIGVTNTRKLWWERRRAVTRGRGPLHRADGPILGRRAP